MPIVSAAVVYVMLDMLKGPTQLMAIPIVFLTTGTIVFGASPCPAAAAFRFA